MLVFLVRRIVFGAAVLLGTSIITFLIAFVIPADPAVTMAGAKADPQTLATIRHQLDLDQPLYVQYARYLDRAVHGDLGRSYIRRESVTRLIASRFPATAVLALSAMAVSLVLGIAMGAVAAAYRGGATDNALLIFSLALVSMPVFWLGTMLLIAGGLYLRSFPLGGYSGPLSLVLPTLTLALGSAATTRGFCIPISRKKWTVTTCAPRAARVSPQRARCSSMRWRMRCCRWSRWQGLIWQACSRESC